MTWYESKIRPEYFKQEEKWETLWMILRRRLKTGLLGDDESKMTDFEEDIARRRRLLIRTTSTWGLEEKAKKWWDEWNDARQLLSIVTILMQIRDWKTVIDKSRHRVPYPCRAWRVTRAILYSWNLTPLHDDVLLIILLLYPLLCLVVTLMYCACPVDLFSWNSCF